MTREDFFTWLDTVIDEGIVEWEVAEDFPHKVWVIGW